MPQQQTIAITGATGFIGGNLVKYLHDRKYRLKILVRDSSRLSLPDENDIEIIAGSLEETDSLLDLVANCDAVIHCAGAVRGVTRQQFNRINVKGTAHLATAAAQQPHLPRFLVLSSLAAREPALSAYANSKKLGEEALASHAGDMSWLALRPPAIYGPGDKEMLPLFKAMAKGIAPMITPRGARFSLLYVDDLVSAMHCWLQQDNPAQGIYELHDGHTEGYDFDSVVDIVRNITGNKIRTLKLPLALLAAPAMFNWIAGQVLPGYSPMLTPGKIRELGHSNWVCSNQALQQALDWQPEYGLLDGLQKMSGWHS